MPGKFAASLPGKLVLGLVCVFNGLLGWRLLGLPHWHVLWDLPQFYLSSQMVRAGQLSQIYNPDAYTPYLDKFRLENPAAAKVTWVYFNRPAFEAPLFAPLSFLSYPQAQWMVLGINLLLLAFLVWKLPQWFPVTIPTRIWLFAFLPFLISIGLGQDTLLLTVLVAGGLHLALQPKNQNDVTAGVLIALAGFKPHLVALLPLAFLAARRWRLFGSYAVTACTLGALSWLMVGTDGIRGWIRLLQAPSTDTYPERMGNLRALAIHFASPSVAIVCGVLVVIAFAVILWRESFAKQCSAALLVALLMSPHAFHQDYSTAAIAGFMAFPPAALLLLLLPWQYFDSSSNHTMIPVIVFNMACLVMLAGEQPVTKWFTRLIASRRGRNQIAETSELTMRSS